MESPQNRQFIYTTNWGVLPEIFWRTGAIFWGVVILPHFPARPVGMVGGSVETPKAHPNRHLEPFLPPQGESHHIGIPEVLQYLADSVWTGREGALLIQSGKNHTNSSFDKNDRADFQNERISLFS